MSKTQSISNGILELSVNELGAELSSLKFKGTEVLWQADKDVWPRHAPVLFPIVGKLKNDTYIFNGADYKLSQHGFARDKRFILVEKSETVLEYELTSDEDSLKVYPFHFSLRIRYELNGPKLNVHYIVFNPSNLEMYFSVGAHPGFICSSLNDCHLEFAGKKELVVQKLSGGLISDETYTLKTDNYKLPLRKELFDNDALVLMNGQVEDLVLVTPKYKLHMHCKGWPYFGIWTKKGNDTFVCLEPWYGIADHVGGSKILIQRGEF